MWNIEIPLIRSVEVEDERIQRLACSFVPDQMVFATTRGAGEGLAYIADFTVVLLLPDGGEGFPPLEIYLPDNMMYVDTSTNRPCMEWARSWFTYREEHTYKTLHRIRGTSGKVDVDTYITQLAVVTLDRLAGLSSVTLNNTQARNPHVGRMLARQIWLSLRAGDSLASLSNLNQPQLHLPGASI